MVGLTRLHQAGHTHRLFICNSRSDRFPKFVVSFSADAVKRARHGSKHRVARAVGKVFCIDRVPGIGRELPALDRDDLLAVLRHIGVDAGAVEKKLNVLFLMHLSPHYAVPIRINERGVTVDILLLKLADDARLAVLLSLCTAYPHTDLGGCVSAEDRSVLHQDDLRSLSRRRKCCAKSRKSASDDTEVGMVFHVAHCAGLNFSHIRNPFHK